MDTRLVGNRRNLLAGGLIGGLVFLLVPQAGLEGQVECGATWTSACASVTTASSGNTLVLDVTNVSSGPDAYDGLLDWIEFTVDPDAGIVSSSVLTGCDCATTALTDPGSCTDITDQWRMKTNDQGSVTWEVGHATRTGTDGIVTDDPSATCNGDCWTNVCFVTTFDAPASLADYAAHIKRLGPDQEDSEWTSVAVPEPVTSTLITLGVAGWAAAHARRRRREGLELEEDEDGLG